MHCTNSIFSILTVLKLYESKAWRLAGHPYIAKIAKFGKFLFQLLLGTAMAQVTYIHLCTAKGEMHFSSK